ncbi:bifunctional 3-(3-hydroxy-phenyl)propionate/3-hydroxycinnamic acid hydroxylase [Herbiconiux daphne]|uniref:Bifunctional 3-(3-hydroxy-phenyl)propionate/3-hydroxycinnamic acid hydroxylase n=1 Tax=Herbiconiux daphne TaxID=2970914 RepID=A0ABT2H731_9MICO|nr:bifunctional 3-(3-hydroxy-phenyl)propionate/3-hydroxycinnamic acid hydroxylase [Herbiconiux daphne]MCS5735731.1 bifunctional 3-(3-hydroxy-phenyl)propionate/3-hydroxycinnamic acid hydroxylase [Herbiconiux daphne]
MFDEEQNVVDTDVLIVGMGPTGIVLAALLGQAGIDVVVADRLPGLFPLPRAIGLDSEVMRVAQELGIAEQLQPHVIPYAPTEYHGVDGQIIKRLDSPPPPHQFGWPSMFAFNQPVFEEVLRARVAQLPSVRVRLGATVDSVGQDDQSVWADVHTDDGAAPLRYRGRYLVACDGGASRIRQGLGISMTDLGFHEGFLVVDAVIDEPALAKLPSSNIQYCNPKRPSTYVVLPDRHRRWEISLEPGELAPGPVSDDEVWPYLARWIQPGEARIWRSASYEFHALIADDWRQKRILLAGDAAHMTPPFMAQGLAQGVRDARNLSWKLVEILRQRSAADSLLDSYQEERRPHVVSTTERTIELGRIICERDEDAARQRDRTLVGSSGAAVPVTIRTSLLPNLSGGLIASSPAAGTRFPQPLVRRDDRWERLDDYTGGGFRVLVDATISTAEMLDLQLSADALDARVVRVLGATGGADDDKNAVTEQDDLLTAWFGELGQALVVVRPDHYVYGTASNANEGRALINGLVQSLRRARTSDSARCTPSSFPHRTLTSPHLESP